MRRSLHLLTSTLVILAACGQGPDKNPVYLDGTVTAPDAGPPLPWPDTAGATADQAGIPQPDQASPPVVADSGVDRSTCTGIASSSGTVSGAMPRVTSGMVLTDSSSGGLKLVLMPASLQAGALTIGLYFRPIAGQLSYVPSGATGCAVLKSTGSSWAVVGKTQLCDLNFSVIKHASSQGTCDGTLAGTFYGVFSGNQPLAGTFYLPSDVAASQITQPSCLPPNSPCTSNSQCCSKSCAPYLGICY